MRITEISTVRVNAPHSEPKTPARRSGWAETAEVANPMSRYPKVKRHRGLWMPRKWEGVWCRVTLEDGTWGLGSTGGGRVTAAIIEDHLAPQLVGEDGLATERLADMMFRLTKPYGTPGLASNAISAVDLALWDARARVLQQPVYTLLGGKQKDDLFCYATGNDFDWYKELGFKAFKLACPCGPVDGIDGIRRNEELVAKARETIGDDCELMLDCWMAFDVEYTVRLAETLRPYRLKWMEECLISEDLDAHVALRERLPWQTLATGEHWYTHVPFQWAANHRAVDIFQPDLHWVWRYLDGSQDRTYRGRRRAFSDPSHGRKRSLRPAFLHRHTGRAVGGIFRRLCAGRSHRGAAAPSGNALSEKRPRQPQRCPGVRSGDPEGVDRTVFRVKRPNILFLLV